MLRLWVLEVLMHRLNSKLVNLLAKHINLVPVAADAEGVEFLYNDDNVVYVWPWKRGYAGKKWISLSFQAYYPTLRAIDEEWDNYFEASAMPSLVKDTL